MTVRFVLIEFSKMRRETLETDSFQCCGYGIFVVKKEEKTEIYVISIDAHLLLLDAQSSRHVRCCFFFMHFSSCGCMKVKSTNKLIQLLALRSVYAYQH